MSTMLWLCLLSLNAGFLPEGILEQAIHHYQKGEYSKAVDMLSPMAKKGDTTPETLFWLAKSYLKSREWDKAVSAMEKAVEMKPKSAAYHLWLGRAYGARAENRVFGFNDARRLLREFRKANELDPNDIGIRFDLLEFYAQAPGIVGGGEEKAWAEAESIAKLDPPAGYTARATIYERKEKWDLAEKEYAEAVRNYPGNPNVHKDMAQFLFSRGNFEGALKNARNALELESDSAQALFLEAVSQIRLGIDLEKAKKSLEKLSSGLLGDEDPAREDVYYWQAVLYDRENDREKAKATFEKALEVNPAHGVTKDYLKKHF
jgi:tetratricopeptide (TPR) repeat protein